MMPFPASYPADAAFRAIAETLDEPVVVVDPGWRLQWANPAAARLLDAAGLTAGGEEFLALLASETRDRVVLDGAVVPGGTWRAEGEVHAGQSSPVEITVHSLDAGAPAGWRWVRLSDRTPLRTLEASLRDARAMDGVGRLALALSHEFSELLTAITGAAELIAGELSSRDDAMRADVSTIQRAADRAAVLTRELTRAASSRAAAPQRTDLTQAVSAMDATLRRTVGERIHLAFDLDPAVGHSNLDLSLLEASIVHLARNAASAMPDGGELRVRTRPVDCPVPRRAVHSIMRPGRYAMVEVSDTGVGMDDSTVARCFEPLYSTWGGEGLGLALVFGATTQMGGYVTCESHPARGTRVSLFLPLALDWVTRPPDALPGMRSVLVVDDEEAVRRVAARTLRREGYRVIEAGDADEALALVSRDPSVADLLLTDVVMPGLSGIELASCIVAARPDVRVLFSSGASAMAVGDSSRLPRGAAFLPKPFTPKALGDRVRALFGL